MESLYDLTPEQQLELVQFARARLTEEKQQRIREIELKEEILEQAEASLREQAANPQDPGRSWRSVGENWPAFAASLVAAPYSEHADFKPVWNR